MPEVKTESLDSVQVVLVESAEAAAGGAARQRHLDQVVAPIVCGEETAGVADVQTHARPLEQITGVVAELVAQQLGNLGIQFDGIDDLRAQALGSQDLHATARAHANASTVRGVAMRYASAEVVSARNARRSSSSLAAVMTCRLSPSVNMPI